MRDEDDGGTGGVTGAENEKSMHDASSQADALAAAAVITGLPDKAFFRSFTARRRREMVYNVEASIDGFGIVLEVHGSGMMKAVVTTSCVAIEGGAVDRREEEHRLSWAHDGCEAVLRTRLDHNHLQQYPDAGDVMRAFLEAVGTQVNAVCAGGVRQWRLAMQLMADRIARERGTPVELVALLPLPVDQTGAPTRGPTEFEVFDVGDADEPARIEGYEDDFKQIDEGMTPEGSDAHAAAAGIPRVPSPPRDLRITSEVGTGNTVHDVDDGFAARGTAGL